MSKNPKIYADFQKLDEEGRLILSCFGTAKDIKEQKINLYIGQEVIFYSDDCDDDGNDDALLVDGTIEFDENSGEWLGRYDENTFTHMSDEKM